MTLEEALNRATVSVPDAGKVFYGLARNASYDAAKRGDIPTIEIGGRKLAVVATIAEKLGLRSTAGKAVA
ncbi:hypothetical protein AJ88_03700 [Mesorhizobium amorphae CCBAU 01583]|nr:hypothetical protein AJ88_03700 [Mesorhizobium amorphae CCBAU 01583]